MVIEHNYNLKAEKEEVCEWVDALNIEYEITECDESECGTIVVFDMEMYEFQDFMDYLRKQGYVK